jgi:anti-sigma regulatory factor (Ser/Thr protein kinase)
MEAVAPRISFPAKSQCLESIRAFCREILESHTHDQQLHRKLVLAIDEAVANVIEHAYSRTDGDVVSTIELSIEVHKDRIVVRILDRGIPFDPRAGSTKSERPAKAPASPAETAHLPPDEDMVTPSARRSISSFHRRGFGLQLIRLIMDEIDYQRTPHGENLLILTKRLRKGADA